VQCQVTGRCCEHGLVVGLSSGLNQSWTIRFMKVRRLFISYRRKQASAWAGRLARDLAHIFGKTNVFYDIDSIDLGVNFLDKIQKTMRRADCSLILIGPNWLDAADESGCNKLNRDTDHVRREIAASLQYRKRTVPVLLGGAKLPHADLLPDDIKTLSQCNAFELRDERWDDDVATLVEKLGGREPKQRKIPRLVKFFAWYIGLIIALSLVAMAEDIINTYIFKPALRRFGPMQISPGQDRDVLLHLRRSGYVNVVVQRITSDPPRNVVGNGTPALFLKVCSTTETNCPRVKVRENDQYGRRLWSGAATVNFFNAEERPVGIEFSVTHPD
jgi:hypothetical protein